MFLLYHHFKESTCCACPGPRTDRRPEPGSAVAIPYKMPGAKAASFRKLQYLWSSASPCRKNRRNYNIKITSQIINDLVTINDGITSSVSLHEAVGLWTPFEYPVSGPRRLPAS